MTLPFAVIVACPTSMKQRLLDFIDIEMTLIKRKIPQAVLVTIEEVEHYHMNYGSLFNAAVRSVNAERYLFHSMTYHGNISSVLDNMTDDVTYAAQQQGIVAIQARKSALTAINGFPNSRESFLSSFNKRVESCKLATSTINSGEYQEGFTWQEEPVVEQGDDIFNDGLWNVEFDKVRRYDEPNMIVLYVFLKHVVRACVRSTCEFICTNVHRKFCCGCCERNAQHSDMCARSRIKQQHPQKRKVLLGLYGLHRNFEKTAVLMHKNVMESNPDCDFTIHIHTSATSRSRRDKGFDGGPVRAPELSKDEIKRKLRNVYGKFGHLESIVIDDTTHFKFHAGHENIHRDKDEPITYRIWSILSSLKTEFDVYMFVRMDAEPCGPISLGEYDTNTFRIVSSSGNTGSFFNNHKWDFCWIGGHLATRLWVYSTREFSTWLEKGLHRDVSKDVKGLESWFSVRNKVVPSHDCLKILKEIGANGNDRYAAWIETHNVTKDETIWTPTSDVVGPDGSFVSSVAPSWTAEFKHGIFYPQKIECLGASPVVPVSGGILACNAPTWCNHGSTFTYRSTVHWRSEQYCRIIKNMKENGCSFGFRDSQSEFFRLRRD